MKLKFIGVGSAFTTSDYYQSNLLITASTGKNMLVDCGTDIRFSLNESCGITEVNLCNKIDAVYISHLHSDHIGGMEWMAFQTYFNPNHKRPKLFMEQTLIQELWDNSLVAGLGCIEGKCMHLTDYFTCRALAGNGSFTWEGICFQLVQMPHICTGYKNFYSYGLIMNDLINNSPTVFFTTDTQYRPDIIAHEVKTASVIFHDCETSGFKSAVHAHYQDLLKFPQEIRQKMWLYHYQPNPVFNPETDGFKGFVTKGQEFEF